MSTPGLAERAGLGKGTVFRRFGTLAIQLTAALEGPLLLYLATAAPTGRTQPASPLADSWQIIVERLSRPGA